MERSRFMTSHHTNQLEYLNFRLPEARDKLSRCVHLRNTPPIFLATPILDADILSKKAWHYLLTDALRIRLCSHIARAAAFDTR